MADISLLNTTAQLQNQTVLTEEGDWTITGNHTFDRDPSAPFTITSGSALVTNLDADKLDGQEGSWYTDLTNVTAGTLGISNGGTGQTAQTAAFDALAPTTTKGDVIVSNGTDNIRLAVGTNNQVLTADSAQSSGVKWAAVTAPDVSAEDQDFTDNTTAGTTEETLDSFSLPGSTLGTDGDSLMIEAWGAFADNTSAKTITIAFGSTDIDFAYTGANTLTNWHLRAIVGRTGATTQVMGANFWVTDPTPGAVSHVGSNTAAPTETLSGAVTVAIKATTPTTSGDATLKMWNVRKIAAAS